MSGLLDVAKSFVGWPRMSSVSEIGYAMRAPAQRVCDKTPRMCSLKLYCIAKADGDWIWGCVRGRDRRPLLFRSMAGCQDYMDSRDDLVGYGLFSINRGLDSAWEWKFYLDGGFQSVAGGFVLVDGGLSAEIEEALANAFREVDNGVSKD